MPSARTLVREPLLHFLLLGVMLFLVYGWLNRAGITNKDEIVVSRSQVDGLVTQFEKVWQRAPTAQERRERLQWDASYAIGAIAMNWLIERVGAFV
jgi:hypothetical protein